jgi:hypothetical protein
VPLYTVQIPVVSELIASVYQLKAIFEWSIMMPMKCRHAAALALVGNL